MQKSYEISSSILIKDDIPKDLTHTVVDRIRHYVNKRIFPNQNDKKLDKEIISDVFKRDLDEKEIKTMLNGLKMSVPCNDAEIASVTTFIKDIFEFTNEYRCDFRNLFIYAIDEYPPDKYDSVCDCLIRLNRLIISPVELYKEARHSTHLKVIIDFGSEIRLEDRYGRVLERGEIKREFAKDSFEAAKEDLVYKCSNLNPHRYANIDFIFGYIICGYVYYLYLIDIKQICIIKEKSIDERLTLIRTYDLHSPVDRVVLIWHKMMITEICQQLSYNNG